MCILLKKDLFFRLWIKFFFIFVALFQLLNGSVADAGETENLQSVMRSLADRSLILDVALAGEKRIVAVGERGHVLVSNDAGKNWSQVITPTQSTLTAVFFIDVHHGWAVGHDSIVLETKDMGDSWQIQYFNPGKEQPLLDVLFRDEKFGIAIGAYGLYLETRDGGKTWSDRYFESLDDPDFGLAHFNAIAVSKNGALYMAGEAGFLAHSEDWGASWKAIEKPYQGSYFTVLATEKGSLLAGGLRGNVYRSENKGETWVRIDAGVTATLNSSFQLPDGRIVLAGLGSTIIISNDDGKSFKQIERTNRVSISSVIGLESNTLIAAGDGGVRRIDY